MRAFGVACLVIGACASRARPEQAPPSAGADAGAASSEVAPARAPTGAHASSDAPASSSPPPAPEAPSAPPSTVSTGGDADEIARVWNAGLPRLRRCLAKTKPKGCISVRWTIASDGHVDSAALVGAEGTAAERCVVEMVKTWQFAPSAKDALRSIDHPINCN